MARCLSNSSTAYAWKVSVRGYTLEMLSDQYGSTTHLLGCPRKLVSPSKRGQTTNQQGLKKVNRVSWSGQTLPYPVAVCQNSPMPAPTGGRVTAKARTGSKLTIRSYKKSFWWLMSLFSFLGPVGDPRSRRQRERHWHRMESKYRFLLGLCQDFASWSVSQKRGFYLKIHSGLNLSGNRWRAHKAGNGGNDELVQGGISTLFRRVHPRLLTRLRQK